MNELANHLETTQSALKALGLLRAEVTNFCTRLLNLEIPNWEALGIEDASWKDDSQSRMVDGEQAMDTSESQKENERSKTEDDRKSEELRQITTQLETRFRELETACTLLFPHLSQLNLGNTQLIGHDSSYEKSHTYQEMVISYRWLNNTIEHSALAAQAIGSKFSKGKPLYMRQRQRMANARFGTNLRNIPLHQMDIYLGQIVRSTDMRVDMIHPFGVFSVLKVTLGRTLCAVLLFRGFVLEWVLVKGVDESFDRTVNGVMPKPSDLKRSMYHYDMDRDNMSLDIWTPSRYQIFRVITDHANTAILHYYSLFQMDAAIKAYLHWLRSYLNLFSDKCMKCNTRLLNCMPPTWRDFRTNPHQAFHFECRP